MPREAMTQSRGESVEGYEKITPLLAMVVKMRGKG